jgi:DNA polymerase-3 subunit delta'
MVFPWQQQQWQHLSRLKSENRLPHALLFTGQVGTGKTIFADQFSRALLCQQLTADHQPCDACHACRLIQGRAHPNVMWLEPEKAGQAIKIDQVRAVADFINQSGLQGDYRVVIINPASNMNINAANALLKTLEEPTPNALLILIGNESGRLPATILSRCQRVVFPCPDKADALQWLRAELKDNAADADLLLSIAEGAPLAALQLQQENVLTLQKELTATLMDLSQQKADPVKAAAKFQEHDLLRLIDLMLRWLTDVLKKELSATEVTTSTHINHHVKLMDHIQSLRTQVCRGLNLNKQLVIESIFLKWMAC